MKSWKYVSLYIITTLYIRIKIKDRMTWRQTTVPIRRKYCVCIPYFNTLWRTTNKNSYSNNLLAFALSIVIQLVILTTNTSLFFVAEAHKKFKSREIIEAVVPEGAFWWWNLFSFFSPRIQREGTFRVWLILLCIAWFTSSSNSPCADKAKWS